MNHPSVSVMNAESNSCEVCHWAHLPSVLTPMQLDTLTSHANSFYQPIEKAEIKERTAFAEQIRSRGENFVATASSATIGAVLGSAEIADLLCWVAASTAGRWIKERLSLRVEVDLDQSWVRRQYAPTRYPPLHAPHGWHQDGALGFNFQSGASDSGGGKPLLEMVTMWMPLVPCGVDSPGLELVNWSSHELLVPDQLAEPCVRSAFPSERFCRPVLEAGDALLFSGAILHRTYVTPAMTRDRTSVELRCFPGTALPARLRGDRFTALTL